MESLYQAKGYREFVAFQLKKAGRGSRSALTEKLGVQLSYLWSVLNGKQDFTPEQILGCAEFFQLKESETEWLMLLLNRDRAASVKVKEYYQRQLNRLKGTQSEVQKRVRVANEVDSEYLLEYYSDWRPIAFTMAIRNPKTRTAKALAEKFSLSVTQSNQVLQLIEKAGMAKFEKDEFHPTQARFHLGSHPAALKLHHTHWRQKALEAIDQLREKDELHYSSVMSIDLEAYQEIRKIILKSIEKMEPSIEKAKDSEVVVLAIDLFKV
jgi:uncharacterized protein (TIGR02147 family)